MRRFEGKYRWTEPLMVEYDDATGLLHLFYQSGRTEQMPLDALLGTFPGGASLIRLIHGPAATAAFPQALAGAGLGDVDVAWENAVITPGVTQMMHTRRCDSGDFAPFAGRPVNLADADLSGVVFGEIDFRPAVLTRTKFTYAAVDRCRFDSGQLAGLDLRHALLAKMDLAGHDLAGTRFDGAILLQTRLAGARLRQASFANARLDLADFSAADATAAVFEGARGIGTRFVGATLADARFDHARLGRPVFSGARLTNASFKDTLLAGARFGATDGASAAALEGVDFDGADLQSADFTATLLTGCKVPARAPRLGAGVDQRTRFVRATVPSWLLGHDWSYIDATDADIRIDAGALAGTHFKAVQAILPRINFAGQALEGADFTGAQLHEARFGGCLLKGAQFINATLWSADFTSANLQGARFTRARLRSSVFAQAWLFDAQFAHSELSDTNFSAAMLAEVNFSDIEGQNMANANFARACLVSANFSNVSAPRVGTGRTTFSAACLAGANFTGATVSAVMFTDAQLSAGGGQITVLHPRWDRSETFYYERTRLLPTQTGADTICPDGRSGACPVDRLTSRRVPEEWKP